MNEVSEEKQKPPQDATRLENSSLEILCTDRRVLSALGDLGVDLRYARSSYRI